MQQPAGSYWTIRRKRKRWQKLVLFLSCLVVFSTTYALILPAITMTEPPLCGLEEHQHGPSCYEVVLNCPFEETESTVQTGESTTSEPTTTSEPPATTSETSAEITSTSDAPTSEPATTSEPPDTASETTSETSAEPTSDAPTSEPTTETEPPATTSETSAETTATASDSEPATPHRHTEDCYQKHLICTLPEHQHSDACSQKTTANPSETAPEPLPQLDADAVRLTELSAAADTALTAHPGETVCFPLSLKTAPILPEAAYSSIRIRLEIVLPLSEEVAAFDLDAMTWLDQTEGYAPSVVCEPRLFGETEIPCQVLTGFLLLNAEEPLLSVAASEWSGSVVVSVHALPEEASFALRVHGAVEFNAWDSTCEEHLTVERLTVDTVVCNVSLEFDPATSLDAYRSYLSAVEALQVSASEPQAANALLDEINTAFAQGVLSETDYRELSNRLVQMLVLDNESVAEACIGTNWMQLRDSGWFTEFSDAANSDTPSPDAPGQLQHTAYAAALTRDVSASNEAKPSDQQIDNHGGSNSENGVTVSKTIEGTELENVFDITLRVETTGNIKELINEPDMAVVIVMDISNTMNSDFGNSTRYKAAMEAAEDFLDKFAASNSLGISKVGYVAFNTDAHEIFALSPCTNEDEAKKLKDSMRQNTGNIINASGYASSGSRYTNIEAGLKMARDMLSEVKNRNRFVIFLSDGFPTTYVSSGYSGYNPIYTNIESDTHKYIRDDLYPNKPFNYGTNYSDRGAVKAREMAESMKNSDITIFSIGVDVAGQSLDAYITQSATNTFSTMDRTKDTYDIGGTSTGHFTKWLGDKIGSGYDQYYYDSTNTDGLKAAYNKIFETIKTTAETTAEADWVASDPVPTVVPGEIEFIGFYDKDGNLTQGNLTGSYAENAENTASTQSNSSSTDIDWDLKKSGYTQTTSGSETTYAFAIKYRVRLKNEDASFIEKNVYDTNGETTLTYRTVQTVNGQQTISERKTIDFPIPSVHGYLGELTFTKQDTAGNPLAGAEFTLSHDTENCSICRGDGKTSVTVPDQVQTSDADGKVTFTNIPSGHTYKLEETVVPAGYLKTGDTWSVVVAYDKVTVTVSKEDGSTETWTGDDLKSFVILNRIYYALPSTGGPGTLLLYVAGGILLLSASGFLLFQKYRSRRREKEADSSS